MRYCRSRRTSGEEHDANDRTLNIAETTALDVGNGRKTPP
jgi:hypothetical protein